MNVKPLIEAEADVGRNLLRTRYAGRPTLTDMAAGVATIRTAMMQLKPGFSILADWSGIEGMELDCVPSIAEVMEMARVQGAAMVVRVLPDSSKDIGINILSAVHLRGTARTVTADNLEAAERLIS